MYRVPCLWGEVCSGTPMCVWSGGWVRGSRLATATDGCVLYGFFIENKQSDMMRRDSTWLVDQKKKPKILPPTFRERASLWSMMPTEEVRIMWPKWRDGKMELHHLSKSLSWMSNRGDTTPHLLMRPTNSTTILPLRWSSTMVNSPM